MAIMRYHPPCVHYESAGTDNQRLVVTWAFAKGLIGSLRGSASEEEPIVGLYDYKGQLNVVTRRALTEFERGAFREAWSSVGEPPENVDFHLAESEEAREFLGYFKAGKGERIR